ncbi:MAG: hypothetical protein KH230_16640 [Enterocloster asparagiformis]|nr:hypothetical protein [Enterocloster asparagiformis]
MKYTSSKKMKQLQKREPSLYVAAGLIAVALLLFILTPVLAEAAGGVTGAAASAAYYLPRLVLAAGLMALFFFIRRVAERRARLEGLDEERLRRADEELAEAEAFAPGTAVYLTEHFLITGDYQFDVVPWEEIERTYYAGDLLAVATTGQKAHVIAAHAEQKAWVKELEAEIENRIARAAQTRARDKRAVSGSKAGGKSAADKGEALAAGKSKKAPARTLKKLPRPSAGEALAGGLALAVPGIAIWMLFSGFAIWGPLLGAMAMFYLISIGYGFGIRGLFTRHKDLSQWNPEQDVRPVLGLTVGLLLISVVAYHVILLVTGYPDYRYTFGYAAAHLIGLLRTHNLLHLFRNRAVLGLAMVLLLGFRYGAGRSKGAGGGTKGGKR